MRPLLALLLALALAGCGGGSGGGDAADEPANGTEPQVEAPEGELSVAQAKEQGGRGITVNGIVYRRLEEWMLCNSLDESLYPPGCSEPSLEIANPPLLASLTLVEGIGQGAGLLWTARPVSLTGNVEGETIIVTQVPTG